MAHIYHRTGFGFFGKGSMVPPPSAPTSNPTTPQLTKVETAGGIYMQDPRCPTGQKMVSQPCSGPDCDPGEMEQACSADPEYEVLTKPSVEKQESASGPTPGPAPSGPAPSGRMPPSKTPAEPSEEASPSPDELSRQVYKEAIISERKSDDSTLTMLMIFGVAGLAVLVFIMILRRK